MQISEWKFYGHALATSIAVGNRLAGVIGFNSNDGETFTNGVRLRPIGSSVTEPTAWFAAIPLKQAGHDAFTEFNTAGPYPILNALGVLTDEISYAKTVVFAESGDRQNVEGRWLEFIAANGYEVIPNA